MKIALYHTLVNMLLAPIIFVFLLQLHRNGCMCCIISESCVQTRLTVEPGRINTTPGRAKLSGLTNSHRLDADSAPQHTTTDTVSNIKAH